MKFFVIILSLFITTVANADIKGSVLSKVSEKISEKVLKIKSSKLAKYQAELDENLSATVKIDIRIAELKNQLSQAFSGKAAEVIE